MRISDWSSDVCSSDLVENEIIKVASNGYIRSNLYVLKGGQGRAATAELQATGTDGPVMQVTADTHVEITAPLGAAGGSRTMERIAEARMKGYEEIGRAHV